MKRFDPNISKVVNFIAAKPEVVLTLLQQANYNINDKTATVQEIDRLTFLALESGDEKFAQSLADAILNNGEIYWNIEPISMSIMAAVSIGSALIGSSRAKKEAARQRQMMWDMNLLQMANQEKMFYDQLRTESETKRLEIFSNSVRQYRESLQKESTVRLRDTWIYVVSIGCAVGIIYALSLILGKQKQNA